jgi:predicted ABC-type ATPase
MPVKDLVILGGPNGAGKTTAAERLLPQDLNIREFVNADEIARGLSPFNPEGSAVAAGRLMVRRMRELARSGQNFAFETTCAGRSHLRLLRECRALGYRLTLLFLWLPTVDVAIARVAERVASGGHSIPVDVIRRRYRAGIRNMRDFYIPAVDTYSVYDNSGPDPVLIAEGRAGGHFMIHRPSLWAAIERATR